MPDQIPFIPLAMGTRPGGVLTPGAKIQNSIGGTAVAGTTGLTQITLDSNWTLNTDTDMLFVAPGFGSAPSAGVTYGVANSGNIMTIQTRQADTGAALDIPLGWLLLRMPKRT